METGLEGATAIVTGGSKGIGLAVTRALAAAGAVVVVGARTSSPELKELAGDSQVRVVEVDLTTAGGVERLVDEAGERIDVLVNNVGGAPARPGGFLSVTDEQWLDSLRLNLLVAVRTTRLVLPFMLTAGRGSIVNISSVNAELPDPAVIDYSAAKGALSGFSKALSKEVGGRGVRVNTVSPGPVATDLWLGQGGVAETVAHATGAAADAVAAGAAAQMVTGRFSQPAEVAAAVVFLAGDQAANITGADLRIDGGLVPTW